MRLISHIKKINIDTVINNTAKASTYIGALTGITGGIHTAYNFSPDKSYNITYNSMVLMTETIKYTFVYGAFGVFNGFIWPVSIPCWIISTIKYVKPNDAD